MPITGFAQVVEPLIEGALIAIVVPEELLTLLRQITILNLKDLPLFTVHAGTLKVNVPAVAAVKTEPVGLAFAVPEPVTEGANKPVKVVPPSIE